MGVAAVIVMMALGDGAKASIEQRCRASGTDVLTVTAGSANVGGVRMGQGAVTTLTPADAAAISRRAGVRGRLARREHAHAGHRPRATGRRRSQGVGPAFADDPRLGRSPGGFFTEDDVERAARW